MFVSVVSTSVQLPAETSYTLMVASDPPATRIWPSLCQHRERIRPIIWQMEQENFELSIGKFGSTFMRKHS